MGIVNPGALLALANDVLPELRKQRDQYHQFWNLLGAATILGWLLVCFLHRIRPLRLPAHVGAVILFAVAGATLGWLAWLGLWAWSWGDYGVGVRWAGELAVCILGGLGWGLATGWWWFGRSERLPSQGGPPGEREQ